jgi:hypothetical protein
MRTLDGNPELSSGIFRSCMMARRKKTHVRGRMLALTLLLVCIHGRGLPRRQTTVDLWRCLYAIILHGLRLPALPDKGWLAFAPDELLAKKKAASSKHQVSTILEVSQRIARRYYIITPILSLKRDTPSFGCRLWVV